MRQLVLFVFAAGIALASPALAGDRYGLAGGPPDRSSLPVDPEILPPDTRPGECVNRRVTGPGGAYRWERVECDDGERGWSDFDRWSYGRPPLRVDDRGAPPPQAYPPTPQQDYVPDRYSRRHDDGPAYAPPAYAQGGYSRQEEGYEYSRESRYDSDAYGAYPPPPQGGYGYATWTSAGRDEYGFLVWPGKQP
ncbi:hypothetical protein [Caulobacter endophyticus]|uniref:hypothetical protein n=1 Tax=Caulobacter endophyticus TaxID=2172652 RepID=UPI0018EE963A|nr:hypothetical protein [Caulobacter endophyticus]